MYHIFPTAWRVLTAITLALSTPTVGMVHPGIPSVAYIHTFSDTVDSDSVDFTPDTTTDTTTATWRHCEAVWEQAQRRLYKEWADYGDIPGFWPRKYPCVRNAVVYVVKAKDFARVFEPYTPPHGARTTKPIPYRYMPRNEFVRGGATAITGGTDFGGMVGHGAMGWDSYQDTVTSFYIDLIDSPYKGAEEFEQLLEGFREHLPLRKPGKVPLIVLNGVPVKDLNTPVDINHILYLTVLAGPIETYPDKIKQFYSPNGSILIYYWGGA